jgi:hypothetical protein
VDAVTNESVNTPSDFYTDSEAEEVASYALEERPCPDEGDGVHKWIFYAACTLIEHGLSKRQAEAELEFRVPNGREGEIAPALAKATGECERASAPKWPARDEALIAEVSKGVTLRDMVACSPDPRGLLAYEVIDALFPDDPLLCIGRDKDRPYIARKSKLRFEFPNRPFIVPSPMLSEKKVWNPKANKWSLRCDVNTGPRCYAVIEFDNGSLDSHAARLFHLKEKWPLVCIVFSGKKSLHGWFPCKDIYPLDLFNIASALGCDTSLWPPCQFARIPNGLRLPGDEQAGAQALAAVGITDVMPRRQQVMFFDRSAIQ